MIGRVKHPCPPCLTSRPSRLSWQHTSLTRTVLFTPRFLSSSNTTQYGQEHTHKDDSSIQLAFVEKDQTRRRPSTQLDPIPVRCFPFESARSRQTRYRHCQPRCGRQRIQLWVSQAVLVLLPVSRWLMGRSYGWSASKNAKIPLKGHKEPVDVIVRFPLHRREERADARSR